MSPMMTHTGPHTVVIPVDFCYHTAYCMTMFSVSMDIT